MEKVIDLRPIKKKLRADSKEARRLMDARQKAVFDRKIQNKLLNLWALRDSKVVLTYVSTPIEVATDTLIASLLSMGKTVAVPKCENNKGDMSFYIISSLNDLESGFFGVMEPVPAKCEKLTDTEGSVCIVPAFMFDTSGYRLGYGKGYYDRFLSSYNGTAIGICYDSNIKKTLMHGKYDRTVDMIVTEKKILNTSV